MDMTRKGRIPNCGSLPDAKKNHMVVGAKQLRKAVLGGRAKLVYLAEDADPAVTEPVEMLCQKHHIPVTWVPHMANLGRACGIEVGAAAAAVLNS